MTLVVVGQALAEGMDGRPAFAGTPSGERLARAMGFASYRAAVEWGVGFENVLAEWPGRLRSGGDRFPIGKARRRAAELFWELPRDAALVLCGGAARAFGVRGKAALCWTVVSSAMLTGPPVAWRRDERPPSPTVEQAEQTMSVRLVLARPW